MADPDDLNPADYKAWSFAFGCDISHGDSGSPLIHRETGEILGIVWTGRIPKSPVVQSSQTLREWLSDGPEDIWKELSFGVPAFQMKVVLEQKIPQMSDSEQKILKSVLGL